MHKVMERIFNPEYVGVILKETGETFPDRIACIFCKKCGFELTKDADFVIDHLQDKHNLKLKQIFP